MKASKLKKPSQVRKQHWIDRFYFIDDPNNVIRLDMEGSIIKKFDLIKTDHYRDKNNISPPETRPNKHSIFDSKEKNAEDQQTSSFDETSNQYFQVLSDFSDNDDFVGLSDEFFSFESNL